MAATSEVIRRGRVLDRARVTQRTPPAPAPASCAHGPRASPQPLHGVEAPTHHRVPEGTEVHRGVSAAAHLPADPPRPQGHGWARRAGPPAGSEGQRPRQLVARAVAGPPGRSPKLLPAARHAVGVASRASAKAAGASAVGRSRQRQSPGPRRGFGNAEHAEVPDDVARAYAGGAPLMCVPTGGSAGGHAERPSPIPTPVPTREEQEGWPSGGVRGAEHRQRCRARSACAGAVCRRKPALVRLVACDETHLGWTVGPPTTGSQGGGPITRPVAEAPVGAGTVRRGSTLAVAATSEVIRRGRALDRPPGDP